MTRDNWRSRGPFFVVMTLAGILIGLFASVFAVAGIALGLRDAVKPADIIRHAATKGTAVVSMTIETGKMDGHPGWPRYTNPFWNVHAGQTVVLRITSYDTGTAPLGGVQTAFDAVSGTISGTESVDGKAVRSFPNTQIAHTFTVVGLGLNLPIPAAPSGGSVTVTARFVAQRAGEFVWQCYAPCGSGPNSMGGAMSVMGWMEGRIDVLA
jgi:FtsP/CotA-like multicopper oxidase with cupredoxin domain